MSNSNNIKDAFILDLVNSLNGDQRVELAEKYINKELISVFKDQELRSCIDAFFTNNLNISETSRNTYMHRNTLIYRIDKIHKLTGLNIRDYHDAVTFYVLEHIYELTKNLR